MNHGRLKLITVSLAALLQNSPNAVQSQTLSIGWVNLSTVRDAKVSGQAQHFAPGVVVRFSQTDGHYVSLAITDSTGTAVVPLQSGHYCANAFGTDGKVIPLAPSSQAPINRCFTIRTGQWVELGLTVTADATYSRAIPPLGVK